jgi:hypothetical protein
MSLNPEQLPDRESSAELAMLRSDLAELFQSQSNNLAFWQNDDFDQPVEIVLGGMCQGQDPNKQKQEFDIEVHIRQRLDDMGTDYLIIIGTPGDYAFCRIADNYASNISQQGDEPMNLKSIEAVRLFLNPTVTEFSTYHSEAYALKSGLFDAADRFTTKGQ